jgi:hypothetical protein
MILVSSVSHWKNLTIEFGNILAFKAPSYDKFISDRLADGNL